MKAVIVASLDTSSLPRTSGSCYRRDNVANDVNESANENANDTDSEYQPTKVASESNVIEASSESSDEATDATEATSDFSDVVAKMDEEHEEPEVEIPDPITRTLGDTDIKLSEICLGTWGLGDKAYGPVSESLFENTINAAIESGISTFDVAPLWGQGWAEEVVGRVLSDHDTETQIITRCGARWSGDTPEQSFSEEDITKDCERSLQRLGRESIDVLLLHDPPMELFGKEEWVNALEKLVLDGKIKAWGASCSSKDQSVAALNAGAKAICIVHNLVHHQLLTDIATDIESAGAGVLVRSPLMHGLLAGRWPGSRRFAPDDHRAERWTTAAMRVRVKHINKLRYLVHDDVINMTAAALRFALTSELVSSVMVGSRQPYQIKEAARVAGAEVYLPKDDLDRLNSVLDAS